MNKKQENFKMKICSDCGLPGNCKNPKKCPTMQTSQELYCGQDWSDFQKSHEAKSPDTWEETTHEYYVSWFTYLLSKGIDLTTMIVVYPTRWVFFDLIPDAIMWAYTMYFNHEKAEEDLKKPFVKERKQKIKEKSSDINRYDAKPGRPQDFDYFGKGKSLDDDSNFR